VTCLSTKSDLSNSTPFSSNQAVFLRSAEPDCLHRAAFPPSAGLVDCGERIIPFPLLHLERLRRIRVWYGSE
jgi:hypothetical protein